VPPSPVAPAPVPPDAKIEARAVVGISPSPIRVSAVSVVVVDVGRALTRLRHRRVVRGRNVFSRTRKRQLERVTQTILLIERRGCQILARGCVGIRALFVAFLAQVPWVCNGFVYIEIRVGHRHVKRVRDALDQPTGDAIRRQKRISLDAIPPAFGLALAIDQRSDLLPIDDAAVFDRDGKDKLHTGLSGHEKLVTATGRDIVGEASAQFLEGIGIPRVQDLYKPLGVNVKDDDIGV
jgi:hypothetical protein